MAIQGTLTVNGKTYEVDRCEYSFVQMTDSTGKPSSRTQGGRITFLIPSPSDDDTFFYQWMFQKTELHSGSFKFCVYSNSNKPSYKTVSFDGAYCVALNDSFDDRDGKLMTCTVTICAKSIKIGASQTEFKNEWGD